MERRKQNEKLEGKEKENLNQVIKEVSRGLKQGKTEGKRKGAQCKYVFTKLCSGIFLEYLCKIDVNKFGKYGENNI